MLSAEKKYAKIKNMLNNNLDGCEDINVSTSL
jgi:hypothetical protein